MTAKRDAAATVIVMHSIAPREHKGALARLIGRMGYWAPEEEPRVWRELHLTMVEWLGDVPKPLAWGDLAAMALYSGRTVAELISGGALVPEWATVDTAAMLAISPAIFDGHIYEAGLVDGRLLAVHRGPTAEALASMQAPSTTTWDELSDELSDDLSIPF